MRLPPRVYGKSFARTSSTLDANQPNSIRKLKISMFVDSFVPPQVLLEPGEEGWDDIRSADHRRELITEPLFKIQNKSGFRFIIEVRQKYIRLNLWREVFDALREPVKVMKDEGAIVKATFDYKRRDDYEKEITVTYDIVNAMVQPEEEWKANAVAFFNAQPEIPDIHRLYRDENRPDFDPKSDAYLTQEEIADREESDHDYMMHFDTYNAPPPHNHVREYMETGTLKHEAGICRCPDCDSSLGDLLRRRNRMHYSSDEDDEGGGHADYDDEEDDDESDDDGNYEDTRSDDEMENAQGGQQSGASHQT